MSIKAMKEALGALEDIFGKGKVDVGAINGLRQAIEEAEKAEPVFGCESCVNRGRTFRLSQESYCEHCVHQETWRKDWYATVAHVIGE